MATPTLPDRENLSLESLRDALERNDLAESLALAGDYIDHLHRGGAQSSNYDTLVELHSKFMRTADYAARVQDFVSECGMVEIWDGHGGED